MAKKYFLTITAGTNHTYLAPTVDVSAEETNHRSSSAGGFSVRFEDKRGKKKSSHPHRRNKRIAPKSKEWVLNKKERQRRQGRGGVRADTRFTGRKRKDKF